MTFLIGAGLTSLALTYASMWLARRLDVLDQPGDLKIHQAATPRLGGLGIVLATLGWLLWAGQLSAFSASGLVLIAIVGALDDKFSLRPWLKLTGQVLSAMLCAASFRDNALMGIAAFVLAVALSNSINLLDGMDGLAAGSAAIFCAGLAWLSLRLGSDARSSLICLGGCAGFFYWNRPRARTFMGDVGSLSIGYLLAVQIASLGVRGLGPLLIGIAMVSVPLFDTALGILRRRLKGRPIFEGDRDHFYDQIQRRTGDGVTTLGIVLALNGAVVATMALLPLSTRSGLLALGGLSVFYAIMTGGLGLLRGSDGS